MVDFAAVANYWAARNFRVLPLYEPSTLVRATGKPAGEKRPQVQHWQLLATTNPAQIAKWSAKWPQAGVGIATGGGIVAIDVDGPEGHAALEALQDEHGRLPDSLTFTSPSDPSHFKYVFRLPPNIEVKNSASELAPKVDVRGWHGFIAAGGSYHSGGVVLSAHDDLLAEIPAWLLNLLEQKSTKASHYHDAPRNHDYLIDLLIQKYPICRKTRHRQIAGVSSYLAVREELIPAERLAIGCAWLRRQDANFETSYDDAVMDLKESLRTTTPYRYDLSTIELPACLQRIIDAVDDRKQQAFLTVIFQNWCWNWSQATDSFPNSHTYVPQHRFYGTLSPKQLSEVPLQITTGRLAEGYKRLTGNSPQKQTIIRLKSHFLSLPTRAGKQTGSSAKFELFIRTEIGKQGKGSTYMPSPTLLALLAQKGPSCLHANAVVSSEAVPPTKLKGTQSEAPPQYPVVCPTCHKHYQSKTPRWKRRTLLCRSCSCIRRLLTKDGDLTPAEAKLFAQFWEKKVRAVADYVCEAFG